MTNILDGMALVSEAMFEEKKCEYEPKEEKWQAKLQGESTTLGEMLGNKPKATQESELSSTCWPSQAHHLIPHLTLANHDLAGWLKSGGSSLLFADTYYNVDHSNNGKWMPYASSLKEWKKGASKKVDVQKNRALMKKVMQLSGIQLHQGPHSGSNTYGIGLWAYKARVLQYLDKIDINATSHFTGQYACEDCKGKKQANKYAPKANTVRYVDGASKRIEMDIKANRVFVSKIAAEFALCGIVIEK